MEEILASIRRIIADDDQEPVRRAVARRDDGLPDARRPEAPRADVSRPVAPRPDASRHPADGMERVPADRTRLESDRAFAPRVDPVRADLGGVDGSRHEASRHEASRPVTVRSVEPQRPDPVRGEPQRPAAPRLDPVRVEVARADPPRAEALRHEPPRAEVSHTDAPGHDANRAGAGALEVSRTALRAEPPRADTPRPEMIRPEPARIDPTRRDAGRLEDGAAEEPASRPVRFDPVRPDAVRLEADRPIADVRRQRDERRPFADDAEAFADLYESESSAALARETSARGVASAPPAAEALRPPARVGLDARPSRPVAPPEPRRKDLLSPAVDAAVMAAFESLGDVSLGQASLPQQGRTVEDLIKEILRPMLKTWLDDHLPDIVERLVRAEIERVARTGR